MEIDERIEINVRKIANGLLVHVAKANGYHVTRGPESFVPNIEAVDEALSSLLAAALGLVVNEESGPDF